MTLLGLTGPSCAGKNYAASILEAKGIPVLDVDKLGHQALDNQAECVAAAFGNETVNAGRVDRRALGRLVFGKAGALEQLESIVHPEVNRMLEAWLAATAGNPSPFRVINAALLHKTACYQRIRAIIVIQAPFWLRVLRALRRDKRSLCEILRRFASQKDCVFNSRFAAGARVKRQTHKFLPTNADIVGIRNAGWGLFPCGEKRILERRLDAFLSKLGWT